MFMLQKFINGTISFIMAFSISGAVFFSGNIKDAYYRDYIGDSVVRVLNMEKTGGGTGFHVEAASGEVFILTNNHVCEAATNGKLIIERNGEEIVREIVARYKQHDLCLVQAIPDFDGTAISIADSLDTGDDVILIGHPGLRDLTLSHGEYIGSKEITMANYAVKNEEECSGQWLSDPSIQIFLGLEGICVESILTSALSAPAYGGNSGSPVVNKYGNLVGVLFAGNPEHLNDSYMVPLKNIKDFLKEF
jgi:S1-C subfamily serine protease